jgi:hypothetical protein
MITGLVGLTVQSSAHNVALCAAAAMSVRQASVIQVVCSPGCGSHVAGPGPAAQPAHLPQLRVHASGRSFAAHQTDAPFPQQVTHFGFGDGQPSA